MPNNAKAWRVLVAEADIESAEIAIGAAPTPAPGQIAVRVDSCGLTANNVTYAALGARFPMIAPDRGYFAFYPSGVDGKGIVPVWGFGTVTASHHPDIAAGERLYGFFPFADTVVLTPDRTSATGFVDATAHRVGLPAVYNQVMRLGGLPPIPAAEIDFWPVFRPLFVTGFLIADQYADADLYGATQIAIASASSKTALTAAYCFGRLTRRPRLIGLTSARNAAYVRGTGLYEEVVTYEAVDDLARAEPTAFVDMAGDKGLVARVHDRFGAALKHSLMVGLSHWDAPPADGPKTGPRIAPFFAPGRLKKRAADWGAAGLAERTEDAWRAFMAAAPSLCRIQAVQGPDGAVAAYKDLVAGAADPGVGIVARFGG